ncbi:hypothetical protein AHiyo1_09320 [Arthrobacter sp. Hiyo1]|uniref:hypothetical protein n=1 Tax=Arthrobacter sp. Hiyo1 TaxID=1588020 RepID=UPI0007231818|nr:hypothetical protein [Arthrobacter sp. Hiyo1]GAP57970.1 hypothetical protein AHiyo1_09320 [Arthrobacter sp. Hiyo1]
MGLDDYRPERTPLDEYAAKVARRLRKRSIPTGYWSARGHTVSGWQLNSESWSSEKDYGGGVWRENWGSSGFLLGDDGRVWSYTASREYNSSTVGMSESASLSEMDLGNHYVEDTNNRVAIFLRKIDNETGG